MTLLGFTGLDLLSYLIFPTIVIALIHLYRNQVAKNHNRINGDPIKVADDYIAHDRKLQAIEILEKAKLEFPNNKEIIKKLIELGVQADKVKRKGLVTVFNFILSIAVFCLGCQCLFRSAPQFACKSAPV
jgi:hypothetical protein